MNSTRTAQAVIAALSQVVTDFVICPGSRSAPLTVAASRFRTHVRIDERSAGFFALGLAKAGRLPAVIVTSGTAVGNLLPAVLEAHHGQLPLVLVTADRPADLVGTGANQTTKQVGIFTDFVRDCLRLPTGLGVDELQHRLAAGLALAAAAGDPGPVQFNVELAEPLVDESAIVEMLTEVDGAEPLGQFDFRDFSTTRVAHRLPPAGAGSLPSVPARIRLGQFPVVIAGDVTGPGSADLAQSDLARFVAAGLPLIAEPSSGVRAAALTFGAQLLDTEMANDIDQAIVFGHPTLHRSVQQLLARESVAVTVVSPFTRFPNPGWGATGVAAAVPIGRVSPSWSARWHRADTEFAASQELATLDADAPITGVELAVAIAAAAPKRLVVGPSSPVRDLCQTSLSARTRCLANRGLAGIDGVVSTAVGVASGAGSTVLYCGDVTFLHDVNGLQIGLGETRPSLRIVVADDQGGSIFATLEYGSEAFVPVFERYFATPPRVDLVALARAYGVPARRIATRAELRAALAAPISGTEVFVVTIDRNRRTTPTG